MEEAVGKFELSSLRGSVSLSEFMYSVSALSLRFRFVCSLYICWKVWCSSEYICLFSVTFMFGKFISESGMFGLWWGFLILSRVISW